MSTNRQSVVTRRRFLQATGVAAAGSALAACGGTAGPNGTSGSSGAAPTDSPSPEPVTEEPAELLTWWDFKDPIIDLARRTHGEWGQAPVELTRVENSQMAQTLQLAKQSDQMPDIYTPQNLEISLRQLVDEGWYQPLRWDEQFIADTFPEHAMLEGIHLLDGVPYSFPLMSHRYFFDQLWFNRELLEQSGIDPDDPPSTYDELRAACQAVQSATDASGWIWHINMPPRMSNDVNVLAQSAGFPGSNGILFETGEYAFDHEAYVTAIEFLLSLQQDDLLFPASATMNAVEARARWAAGAAAFFIDGPWNAGIVSQEFGAFADNLGVGPMLVPEAGMAPTTYQNPMPGVYFISGSSQYPEQASDLLKLFTTEDYHRGLAESMVEPPLNTDVIGDADVHPTWTRYIELSEPNAFLAPSAVVKNSEVSKVNAEIEPVNPNFGTILQGIFTGDVTDVLGALRDLSERHAAARDEGLEKARTNGADIDEDVWAFADWSERDDYGFDRY